MPASRINRAVTATAGDGSRMTLGDLRAFIAELDQAGAAETTPVSGRVSFGGYVKELKATAVRFGDPEPR
jgi:hypothetical protein